MSKNQVSRSYREGKNWDRKAALLVIMRNNRWNLTTNNPEFWIRFACAWGERHPDIWYYIQNRVHNNLRCIHTTCKCRLPSYTVQALGYKAWYVELSPFRFHSQDSIPEPAGSLSTWTNIGDCFSISLYIFLSKFKLILTDFQVELETTFMYQL